MTDENTASADETPRNPQKASPSLWVRLAGLTVSPMPRTDRRGNRRPHRNRLGRMWSKIAANVCPREGTQVMLKGRCNCAGG